MLAVILTEVVIWWLGRTLLWERSSPSVTRQLLCSVLKISVNFKYFEMKYVKVMFR